MNITISNVTDGSKIQFVVRAYTKLKQDFMDNLKVME